MRGFPGAKTGWSQQQYQPAAGRVSLVRPWSPHSGAERNLFCRQASGSLIWRGCCWSTGCARAEVAKSKAVRAGKFMMSIDVEIFGGYVESR